MTRRRTANGDGVAAIASEPRVFASAAGSRRRFASRRDLRFARDRRPLRERVEGLLSRDGRRSGCRSAIHVGLVADDGFLRAGSFLQPPEARRARGDAMCSRHRSFLGIAGALEEAGNPLTSTSSLRRAPRGFETAARSPLGSYLRMNTPVAQLDLRHAE